VWECACAFVCACASVSASSSASASASVCASASTRARVYVGMCTYVCIHIMHETDLFVNAGTNQRHLCSLLLRHYA